MKLSIGFFYPKSFISKMNYMFVALFLMLFATAFGAATIDPDEEEEKPFVIPEACFPQRIQCPAYFKHWRYNPQTKECTQHYFCLKNKDDYMTTKVKCLKTCTPPERKKGEKPPPEAPA